MLVSLGSLLRQSSAEMGDGNTNGDGYSLRCGRIQLYSVPLQYLFEPRTTEFRFVVPTNAEVFVLAHENRKFAEVLTKTVNTIDGRVLQGICKLLYPKHEVVRQNGSNFVYDLAEHCQRHALRLFFVGSTEKANSSATQRLRERFPGLQVSGFSPPSRSYPFSQDWNDAILKKIEDFAPRHIVVCFGAPKQEFWIHENSSRLAALGVRCSYCMGGTIDFVSGVKPRAPKWIEFIGAEWLFRLVCEPRARFIRTLRMFRMLFYAARTARTIRPLNSLFEE